jgi:hypothetical protein
MFFIASGTMMGLGASAFGAMFWYYKHTKKMDLRLKQQADNVLNIERRARRDGLLKSDGNSGAGVRDSNQSNETIVSLHYKNDLK